MSSPADALVLLEACPPVRVLEDESSLPAEASEADVRARLSGLGVTDDAALFSALAAELGFPPYFGANWDALLDSLRDLGDPRPASVRLVVEDAGEMLSQAPRTGALLIETWTVAAHWWAGRGVPFQLVLLIRR